MWRFLFWGCSHFNARTCFPTCWCSTQDYLPLLHLGLVPLKTTVLKKYIQPRVFYSFGVELYWVQPDLSLVLTQWEIGLGMQDYVISERNGSVGAGCNLTHFSFYPQSFFNVPVLICTHSLEAENSRCRRSTSTLNDVTLGLFGSYCNVQSLSCKTPSLYCTSRS